MSFNRPIYDSCAYDKRLDESTSVLTWLMDPNKFYNCNECRVEFGIVGGNNVSRFTGNMVDLESDLRNQTRLYTHCPGKKFVPNTVVEGKTVNGCKPGAGPTGLPCGSVAARNDAVRHLPNCNIIQYKQRIDNVGYELNYPACPAPGVQSKAKKAKKAKKTNFVPQQWQGQQGQY